MDQKGREEHQLQPATPLHVDDDTRRVEITVLRRKGHFDDHLNTAWGMDGWTDGLNDRRVVELSQDWRPGQPDQLWKEAGRRFSSTPAAVAAAARSVDKPLQRRSHSPVTKAARGKVHCTSSPPCFVFFFFWTAVCCCDLLLCLLPDPVATYKRIKCCNTP